MFIKELYYEHCDDVVMSITAFRSCVPSLIYFIFSLLSGLQLRYGEPTLRRAVPLALALISVSNPRLNILDTLSKFSHDADPEVSHNSIFAMGMVGSGQSPIYI